jgi:ABC-type phosphate transport system ATPase subunit
VADQTALFWPQDEIGILVEVAQTKDFFLSPKSPLTKRYVEGLSG